MAVVSKTNKLVIACVAAVSWWALSTQNLNEALKRQGTVGSSTGQRRTTTARWLRDDSQRRQTHGALAKQEPATVAGSFDPGSLDMTKAEVLSSCLPAERYKPAPRLHLNPDYKTQLYIHPKVGSSTLRVMAKNNWNCSFIDFKSMNDDVSDGFRRVTMVRNPFNRFTSAYLEAAARFHLYPKRIENVHQTVQATNHIPEENRGFLHLLDSIPKSKLVEYSTVNSTEALEFKTKVFISFVRGYNPSLAILDTHFWQQTARLHVPGCASCPLIHFDEVLEFENFDEEVLRLERLMGAPQREDPVKQGRPGNRAKNLNMDLVPKDVVQKICRLNARDFCCLNYELPSECQGVVKCIWTESNITEQGGLSKVIEPVLAPTSTVL